MSDQDIIKKCEASIGCHFTQFKEIDYRNNNAHYVVDPDTDHICGLRLPMRTRIIPREIFELTHLTVLDISLVKISSLPQDLLKLKKLKKLNIYDSEVQYLPAEIGSLSELVTLNLARTPLAELPESICDLKNLQKLYLWGTKIRQLPENIGNLQQLRTLDLSECRLRTLPESIIRLQLDFKDNSEFDCIKITGLSIDDKKIYQNIKLGKKYLADYFKNRTLHPEKISFESRLVLLGNGGAGKTCIMHALLNNFFDPMQKKTEGITVSDWIVDDHGEKGCIHIWDFGGQEAYQPLYSLFLAKSDLYLIVLNGRSDEKPDYWLEFIRFFACHAPVIIVINRTDENPRAKIDGNYIRKKFRDINIVAILNCSCKDYVKPEGNIHILRKYIINTFRDFELKLQYQENLNLIRQRLYAQKNIYSYSDFCNCCFEFGISYEEGERLFEMFHNYGIIIKPTGSSLFFVNPNWFANIVSRLYYYAEMQKNNYIFSKKDIFRFFLSTNPPIDDITVDSILSSLANLKICITDNDNILVPSVLPLYTGKYEEYHKDQEKYVIIYNTSSSLFFHRLLAHLYPYLESNEKIWYNAIEIKLHGDIIFLEQQGNEILIYLPKSPDSLGLINSMNYLLTTLQSVCDELRMANLTFEVFIPQNQRRNTKLAETINMFGGQINAPSGDATVNASYMQFSGFTPEQIKPLLDIIDNQLANLDKKDQILARNASEDLKKATSQKIMDKELFQNAVKILTAIKGTVEFTAAVTAISEFIKLWL